MSEQKNLHYILKLWFQPSHTIHSLIESNGGHGPALIVAALFGFVQALPFYLSPRLGGTQCFLIGAVLGVFSLYLFAWLLRNFGRWFGGQAELSQVRTGLGLSLMPWLVLFAVLFWLRQSISPEVLKNYYWLFFLGFVYGYTIILLSLSAALRLSALKTFLCLIVTLIVSFFPLTLVLQFLFPHLAPSQ